MRLANFMREHIESILIEWEAYARTINTVMTPVELRDHAKRMLQEIIIDIAQEQSNRAKMEKSKGNAPDNVQESAAELHGKERLEGGFDINETMSEFRALRATVINLWAKTHGTIAERECEEITRFNEAIDKAIAESLTGYSKEKELVTRLLETIMLASPEPIFVLDADGRFIFANKACERVFELDEKAIICQNIFDLSQPFSADLQDNCQKAYDTGLMVRGDISIPMQTKQRQVYECLLRPVLDGEKNVEAIVSTWHDITERKIAEQKSWHQANHDPLTDLPNRRLFLDQLEREVKHAVRSTLPLAVMFIDLDGFKEVNDTLGHQVGDRLLCSVADRLNFCVRKDDIVARLGGDEFTIVLTNLHEDMDVRSFATKIVELIAEPFLINQNSIMISCSIGIAIYYQITDTPESLLRRADQAMYAAKESGRNQIRFMGPHNVSKVGCCAGNDAPI